MLNITPMKCRVRTIFTTLGVIVASSLPGFGWAAPIGPGGPAWVSGRARTDPPAVVVRLAPGEAPLTGALAFGEGSRLAMANGPAPLGLESTPNRALAAAAVAAGVAAVEAPFASLVLPPPTGALPDGGAADRLSRTYRFVLGPGADIRAAAALLEAAPGVEAATPDGLVHALWVAPNAVGPGANPGRAAGPAPAPGRGTQAVAPFLPNDPFFVDGTQWALSNSGAGQFGGVAGVDIGAPLGWALTTGNTSTLVSVVDTGFDLHHPELVPHFSDGRPRLFAAVNGSNEGEFAPPDDSVGHGTLVAGIVFAATNNGAVLDGTGVAGVIGGSGGDSLGCRVIEIKATPGAYTDALATEIGRSIVIATNLGARAINLSFAGDDDFDAESDAITYAQTRGAVVVCGAGNGTDERPQYPGYHARYGNGVSVASINSSGALSGFSTHGPQIDVVAPGENIMSTYLTYENAYGQNAFRDYTYSSGTSFAAPQVTGLAGLAASLQPSLNDNEFQEILRRTARDVGAPGRDDTFGWGIADAPALLARLAPPAGFVRGLVKAQTWTLVGTDSVTLSKTAIVRGGCEANGHWLAQRYLVQAHVSFPPGVCLTVPDVIVHTHGSNGWGPGPLLEYNYGWGEVVPGTLTTDGVDLRAYVYFIANPPSPCSTGAGPIAYVPVQPQDVVFDWAALAKLDGPPTVALTFPATDGVTWPVDAPDTLRWTAADPDTVSAIDVEQSLDGGARWTTLATLPGDARAFAWKAPCGESWEDVRIRVRARDDRGGQHDAATAMRKVVPDRECLAGETPTGALPFALFPVAPNPAPAGGTFRLILPGTAGEATTRASALVVYDARGRAVWRRTFAESEVGEFVLAWDGRDTHGRRVPPGVYFSRLSAWDLGVSRRFIIVGR